MRRLQIWMTTAVFTLLTLSNQTIAKAQGGYYNNGNDGYYNNQGNYGASYQDFYDGLAPYGQWISDPQYGYVWMPDVGADFRPYFTNGYWAMTEYGNTWVSNYQWGWAPFHYGRWTFDNYYGWLWIPDTQWAPAWVSWRSNNSYYGWAPMGPGVNINVSLGLIPVDWWVFLSPTYFYDRSFYNHCNDWRYNRNVYNQTNYINYTYRNNNNSYYTGPRGDDYQRRTGRRASMFSINNSNSRGTTTVRGNRINMYRPNISRTTDAAPGRIAQTDRRISTRPQSYIGATQNATGREQVLRERPVQNTNRGNAGTRQNNIAQPADRTEQPDRANVGGQRLQQQRDVQVQQQRDVQIQQQRVQQQQRDVQVQQQQAQQQQRDAQLRQQRVQQQQRDAQMQQQQAQQQQRDAQLQQQRVQQQQRDAQMQQQQQQRDAQLQQQRMQQQQQAQQQQRDAQMQQQRAQQQQQRDAQQQQQRFNQRAAPAQQEQAQPAQREQAPQRGFRGR